MSQTSDSRPNRARSQDMWPRWMWVAVPILVVVVVIGLWWAIFDTGSTNKNSTPTPTINIVPSVPTAEPTMQNTLEPATATPTRPLLVETTPTTAPDQVATPTGEPTAAASTDLAIGATAKVTGTGGQGVNMRSGAGTANARIKTLGDGTVVEIIGGPTDANSFTWWQVRDEAGVTGWVVSKYLVKQ